ncbi:MAG TPA: hypothetical protein VFA46_04445 [Actinomycetes bacterium]|nr:hypothetical protein [Actinomycetes bacterium]
MPGGISTIFHPYVAVGRDYYGDSIMALAEYRALEAQLNETYPERFAEPLTRSLLVMLS